jgi:RecA-family ATPase
VITQTGATYDPSDIRDLLDEYGDRTLFTRKEKPKTNGHDTADNGEWTGPIDVDALLAAMRLHGKDGAPAINQTLTRCSASLLHSGLAVELVIEQLLDAIRSVLTDDEARTWNREEDRFKIEGMCFRFVEKNPHLAFTLPDALRSKFEELHNAGKAPRITRNRYGWYVKASNGNGDHHEHAETNGNKDKEAPYEDPNKERVVIRPFVPFDLTTLPPRQWLYGRHYQRRIVSSTIAPGGTGKTTLVMVEAVAMATGRNLLGEQPEERCRVWIHNGEDSFDELRRRLGAICLHYGIPHEELRGWFFMTSGNEMPLRVANGYSDLKIDAALIKLMTQRMLDSKLDVAIFDPLVTLHGTNEQDNNKMDIVVRTFAGIADVCDCSIELSHHVRKLAAGMTEHTGDDSRGASAVRDAVRAQRVLNVMSVRDAEEMGIGEFERLSYFRVDRGKNNTAPPASAATWRRFVSVILPNEDNVGVVTEWRPPSQSSSIPTEAQVKTEMVFLKILDRLTVEGRTVNDRTGFAYAPKVFEEEPEARDAKLKKRQLKDAMRRLFAAKRIRVEEFGREDRPSRRIVRVGDE